MKARDVTGMRFARLVAIRRTGTNPSGGARWLFKCDCGLNREATLSNVLYGNTKSCGCLNAEVNGAMLADQVKHGHSAGAETTEYKSWKCMRQRCFNPNDSDYLAYGGRGISVCERWASFANFLNDMGCKPTRKYSIDRIDTNGNYEPENCRWANATQQNQNRRPRGTGEYAKRTADRRG